MSIFIGQLIGFAVIVLVMVKWVFPLIGNLMRKQQEAIRVSLEESALAAQKLAEADEMHAKAIAEAKAESAHVTTEARQDSERIAAQLGEQAGVEAERIKAQGVQQVQLMRQQLVRQLRNGLGEESVAKADEIVRSHLADPAAQSASVDRFLDELDSMAPSDAASTASLEAGAPLSLRAASREALAAVVKNFDATASGLDATALSGLASDLTSVAKLLLSEPVLAKHLADSSDNPEPKVRFVDSLFADKIGAPALNIVKSAAAQRWSAEANLVDAVEHVARLALLVRAEQAGEGEQVEEQLFRLGRALDDEPRLTTLLSDYTTPSDGRVALLNKVLSGTGAAVNPTAAALLAQTVELLRGEHADEAVIDLAELAVARRGEVVAQVTAAAELTTAQRTRLTEILSRIYSHPVAVQLNIDPAVLGGLQIAVGDEVIDGAISSQLAAARSGLPD